MEEQEYIHIGRDILVYILSLIDDVEKLFNISYTNFDLEVKYKLQGILYLIFILRKNKFICPASIVFDNSPSELLKLYPMKYDFSFIKPEECLNVMAILQEYRSNCQKSIVYLNKALEIQIQSIVMVMPRIEECGPISERRIIAQLETRIAEEFAFGTTFDPLFEIYKLFKFPTSKITISWEVKMNKRPLRLEQLPKATENFTCLLFINSISVSFMERIFNEKNIQELLSAFRIKFVNLKSHQDVKIPYGVSHACVLKEKQLHNLIKIDNENSENFILLDSCTCELYVNDF
jgi:hypothetical protein